MNVCTIIALNYIAHARVLAGSMREHHPDAKVWVLILDDDECSFDASNEAFEVLRLDDLPNLDPAERRRMATMYDVMELATAVKPWLLEALLTEVDTVAYFDPDIEIFDTLDHISGLARRHGIVLTPHNLRPIPRDGMTPVEAHILQSGIYNLGFVAVGRSAIPFLAWWKDRLRRDCIVDLSQQLFVDQRWIDFVPGLFDHVVIRDPGCNVAYWNLPQRTVEWTGRRYEVNGHPLRFFHYSGYSPDRPHILSKHQGDRPRVHIEDYPAVARLCRHYRDRLIEAGFRDVAQLAYGLNFGPGGLRLDRRMRRLFRDLLIETEEAGGDPASLPDPFDPEGEQVFIEWLRTPRSDSPRISLYLKLAHEERRDLEVAFPDLLRDDADRYLEWIGSVGTTEAGVPPELATSFLGSREFGGHVGTMAARWQRKIVSERAMGVNAAGYFFAESGVGEHGRGIVASIEAAGLQHSVIPYRNTQTRQEGQFLHSGVEGAVYGTNLIAVNADELPNFVRDMGTDLLDHRYNIGYWAWEVDVFPEWLHDRVPLVDEIWANSKFTAANIGRVVAKPVLACPPVVMPPVAPARSRHSLGLPEEFLFLFCFDYQSIFERKNPLALVDAFRRAFAPGEGPRLLIKTVKGDEHPAHQERLLTAVSDRPDIEVRDGYVDGDTQKALMAACDVYVSLHRAEGFGLTLAEAMAHGKPVIATGYSGNLDFMDERNSFLVPWSWGLIPPGCEPYPIGTGWAEPDVEEASAIMRYVYEHPEEAQARGALARREILENHGPAARGRFMRWRLAAIHSSRPELFARYLSHHPEEAAGVIG